MAVSQTGQELVHVALKGNIALVYVRGNMRVVETTRIEAYLDQIGGKTRLTAFNVSTEVLSQELEDQVELAVVRDDVLQARGKKRGNEAG